MQVAGVVAPVMSASSSRGPNQADLNVLKPDITGPGTDIIAAFANRGLTQAERDAVAAGTLIPDPWADMISGTSMSSPHSAGVGALLRQANPTWSPYAIKSAIMTSALQNVKLANGATDTNRWGFGAGHLNPNVALATKVVFDQTNADHLAYYNGTLNGSAMNLASMTAANVIGIQTFTRKLTNKGTQSRTYIASASVPGFSTVITPASFTIAPGATQTFTVQVTRTTATIGTWVFGEMILAGDDGVNLRSPVTVRPQSFVGVATVTDTRTIGTKVYTVATGYTGSFLTTAIGMVPAQRLNGTAEQNDFICFPFAVPAGAKQLRAQMFNSETGGGAASDLDLYVFRGATQVGGSGNADSNELVIISNPVASANYEACVDGFSPFGWFGDLHHQPLGGAGYVHSEHAEGLRTLVGGHGWRGIGGSVVERAGGQPLPRPGRASAESWRRAACHHDGVHRRLGCGTGRAGAAAARQAAELARPVAPPRGGAGSARAKTKGPFGPFVFVRSPSVGRHQRTGGPPGAAGTSTQRSAASVPCRPQRTPGSGSSTQTDAMPVCSCSFRRCSA